MKKSRIRLVLAVALLCAAAASAVHGAETLEGRWLLEEQSYGAGKANQAHAEKPLRLEFYRKGGDLLGRVWFGGPGTEPVPWPSLAQAPLRPDQVVVSHGFDRVRARYRAVSAAGQDVVLEITEEYRLTDGGVTLSGTVHVALLRGEASGGSYVLQRRFRREP